MGGLHRKESFFKKIVLIKLRYYEDYKIIENLNVFDLIKEPFRDKTK